MTDDLDDTVISTRRPEVRTVGPDNDDTVLHVADTVRSVSAPPIVTRAPARRFGFRVSGAEPIPLDVPSVVGRRPHPPRVLMDEPPRLVTVPSAERAISGSHVEVRQLGESVVLTDLRSTNGTTVRMPGTAPISLRQGASAVVTPGSTAELGDGVVLEIVSLDRIADGVASD